MTKRVRRTVAAPTDKLVGAGIHTGELGWIRILPAETKEQGIVFRSASRDVRVRATSANVSDTRRCTVLRSGDFSVQTVEHLLSACSGMGLTDATILIEGQEIPILDGSALPFVEAIAAATLIECGGTLVSLICPVPLAVTEGESTMIAYPASSLSISVIVDYPSHSAIGVQAATYLGVNYHLEVAPARTYGFLSEIESLQHQGLALGAEIGNGIGLHDDGSVDERTPLRFANELARHKLLDVMGDLALLGRDLQAGIVAIRPSHGLNTRFARLLASTEDNERRKI